MRIWREAQNRLGFVLETTLQLLLLCFLHCPCAGSFGHLSHEKVLEQRICRGKMRRGYEEYKNRSR
jgi:hypothetical protein